MDRKLDVPRLSSGNLDFHDDEQDQLEFRDSFPGYSDVPEIVNEEEQERLLSSEKPETKPSFWDIKYYQNLFNVDTNEVIQRIIWSFIPRPGRATYIHRLIRPNPDLYGPIWISATLVFTLAISSNMADYLHSVGRLKSADMYYDYRKVSFTATTLYSYIFLIPLAVWGMLWYFNSSEYGLLEVISTYGYSLAIYIPIAILWLIKSFWFHFIIILIGFILSSSVLMLTFYPAVQETRKKVAGVILIFMLLFHLLLAFGFSVYFFHPITNEKNIQPSSVTTKAMADFTEKIAQNDKSSQNPLKPEALRIINRITVNNDTVNNKTKKKQLNIENNSVTEAASVTANKTIDSKSSSINIKTTTKTLL
ncbi:protein YIPF1 [Centruroides vittatus]|uniref:protein YIPF1 n=1 Tax=Centruroides vittatus TaxID=120091 RepID=UPI00350F5683